jgi:hypothetical protein
MACTQFNLHFYEDRTVCLTGLIRVEFKDRLLRDTKGGVSILKHHVMKMCVCVCVRERVELRHSFDQDSADIAKSSSHVKL